MNLLFQEGDLSFSFAAEHWVVRKYDAHPYFKGFSGVGLKGVDFVAVFQNKKVLLIEVKNYQTKNQIVRAKDVALSLSEPEKIAKAINQKFEDTLAGIKAIHTYYQRKSKLAWKWLQRWQKPDPEALFWRSVCDLVLQEKAISKILWLEYDPQDQHLAVALGSALLLKSKHLPGTTQIFNHRNHPYGDLLLVSDK